MTVPTSNITMTNLNTVFAKGFSLSGYYGTTFSSGSAPASGTISYSMFSGKSPPVAFNPTSLSAPLITWFKGDSGLTTSSWTNYGTNGGSATLTAGTAISTINGLSVADFTGAGNPHGSFPQNFSGQPRACFIVIRFPTTVTTSQHLIAIAPGFDFVIADGTNLLFIQQGAGANLFTNNMPTLSGGQTYVLSMINSTTVANNLAFVNGGTSLTFQVNLAAWTSGSGSFPYNTGATTPSLNYYNSGNVSSPNYICEVLCYDGEVSATDAVNVNTYLKTKWGIA